MRAFWALIAVLVVAAGAALWLRGGETAPSPLLSVAEPDRAAPPPVAPAPVAPVPDKPAAPAESLDDALRTAAKDAGVQVDLPATRPEQAALEPAPAPAAPVATPIAEKLASPVPSEADMTAVVADVIGDPSAPLPDAPVGVTMSRRPDGALLLDNRFIVRGEGTAENPYEIAWEFLMSASETYKPRLGQKKLPDWLEIINNKHVRITGFIAFPLMAQSPDEMLVMLNQWDGCCIGLPPTPYDAVEIKLKDAVKGDDRLKTFGTVEGLFSVDPYLVKDWLIGLYLMKDARLSNTTGVQTSPHVTRPEP